MAAERLKPKAYGKHLRQVCDRHRALPLPEQRIQGRKSKQGGSDAKG